MRYQALAADYDGTLADEGIVDAATVAALERFVASGRKLILVTGRQLEDLQSVFPQWAIFHRIVAENGAVLFTPGTGTTRLLAPEPAARFVDELRQRDVSPLSVGQSIVATVHPHETVILDVIRQLGLELQVVFNKGSVMVLPGNVNKATGLECALEDLGLSRHNVVAVGDAENDHALIGIAEYGVAVANAVPMLKSAADRTTRFPHGPGVVELIDDIVGSDLAAETARSTRRRIVLGCTTSGDSIAVTPEQHMLVVRPPPPAKPVFSSRLCERIAAVGYQSCVIVPSGDPLEFGSAILFGTKERPPAVAEIVTALEKPNANVVVSLAAEDPDARLVFFRDLAARLRDLAMRCGRPHFLILDEAHELLDEREFKEIGGAATTVVMTTSRPDALSAELVAAAGVVIAVGDAADDALALVAQTRAVAVPERGAMTPSDDALFWTPGHEPVGLRFAISGPPSSQRLI
jgi:HAD superfamily hydrolase (TIGR01484 family)